MSAVANWLKRHRRKFVVGGAVVGGLYLVGRIAEKQIAQNQERETLRLYEKARKQNHFSATESTCTHTLAALFPTLRKVLEEKLDADKITAILRQKPSPEDKIEFWNELKVIAFSRCIVLVIGGVYLSAILRIQLNILAGYLYEQEIAAGSLMLNNNTADIKKGKISSNLQEKFLNICTYFVTEGVEKLCSIVVNVVKRCTERLNLNEKLSLVDLEASLNEILECCKVIEDEKNIFKNPGYFFIPESEAYLEDFQSSDQMILKQMLADTLDVADSEDSITMTNLICKQGLSHLMDKFAEYYSFIGPSGAPPTPSSSDTDGKNSLHDSGFVSPANVSLPLAKLIPILTAQIRISQEEEDDWLLLLQDNTSLKLLGANVYEAFCEMNTQMSDAGSSGWGEYVFKTIKSFF